MKELKDSVQSCTSLLDDEVESGEGIERYRHKGPANPALPRWNPVKELKASDRVAMAHITKKVESGEGIESGRRGRDQHAPHEVESGEGIESSAP